MTTAVASSDKFLAVTLTVDDKQAVLPLDVLPDHLDIQIALKDGRVVHVKQGLVTVTDLDGQTIASMAIPAQKPEQTAKAARLEKIARHLTQRLHEVAQETEAAFLEAQKDEATALPSVIPLPGPSRAN